MNARFLVVALLCLATPALGQGFAGMAGETGGFSLPEPGHTPVFPADHGAHPAFRIEWWYLTANLDGPEGRAFGVQWTLFRAALKPERGEGWQTPQIWFAHAAATTRRHQFTAQRRARGGIGQAGVRLGPFDAWIDSWEMTSRAATGADALSALELSAAGSDFAYELRLEADGPIVRHGKDGYSVKSEEGQASYYYSQPFYRARGTLTLPGGEVPVTGRAWFDHEWSSQPLSEKQEGWDWIALHFADGTQLMGYRMRETDGEPYVTGTWIAPDGTANPLAPGALAMTPTGTARVAGRTVPVEWRVRLPSRNLDVTLDALNDKAWMDADVSYWEGPVAVSGSREGEGYLEMTGYE